MAKVTGHPPPPAKMLKKYPPSPIWETISKIITTMKCLLVKESPHVRNRLVGV